MGYSPGLTASQERVALLNARVDRLPIWGISGTGKAVLALAYFFAFYDIIAIGVVLPTVAARFHLTGAALALPVTTNLFGYIVGAYGFGTLADYMGRKRALIGALGVLALGGLLTAFSWNDASLSVFRFITGIGTGAQISLCATLIAELSPASLRGRNLQRNIIWAGVGDAAAPFIGLAFLGISVIGWRLVLGFGVLAVIPIILAGGLPESPRWFILHHHATEAESVVSMMESHCVTRLGEPLPAPRPLPAEKPGQGFPTRELLRPPYLGRLLVALGYWVLTYVTVYGFLGYEPLLLGRMGLSAPQSLLYTALGDIAFPLGAALPLLLIKRMPRKYILFVSSLIFAAALAVLAISHTDIMVFLGAFFVALMILINSGIGYTYTSEIFPTRARASATSLSDGIGHIGGVVAPFIVIAALGAWGARGTFGMMAILMVLCAILIVWAGLRTMGDALTTLSE